MRLRPLDAAAPPRVTVVCPVRDERASIADVVGALERQTYAASLFEVIVVDGGSVDGTAEWVRDHALESCADIQVIDNPQQTTPFAMNLGIQAAKGEVIVLVGGHTVVADDFIAANVRALAETGAACTGGRIDTVGEGAIARAIAIAQSSWLGVGGVTFRTACEGAKAVDTVAFGAYRREVFDQVGLFDEELVRNQDDELSFRITQAGGLIWFDSRIRSTYRSRATLRKLRHQYRLYGLFKVLVIVKRGGVPAARHLVPAFAVTALAGSVAVGALCRRPLVPAVTVGGYVGVVSLGGIAAARRDPAAAPWVPAAIASLHIPYGVGFIQGLWRFRGRWKTALAARRGRP